MRSLSLLTALLLVSGLLAQQKEDPTPFATYNDLLSRYQAALAEFSQAYEQARSLEQKQKIYQQRHPRPGDYAGRFLDLARKYPRSPVAVDALVWVVTHPVAQGQPGAEARSSAFEILQTQHLDDDRIGRLCTQLVMNIDPASETFLRKSLAGSSRPGVLARACTSLAHNLKTRARLLTALAGNTEARTQLEAAWGKPAIDQLVKSDPKQLLRESAALFERVIKEFGTVPHPTHGNLAGLARAHLQAIHQPVTVGQPAPPLEGTDLNGKPLAVADLKGRVVLLFFWADSLPPCRENYASAAKLLARQAGQPFVLLGVNADADRDIARKALARAGLQCPTFWDGGNVGGPLATRCEVEQWPSVILIDAQGIVRQVWVGWPEAKILDSAVDQLVQAAREGS